MFIKLTLDGPKEKMEKREENGDHFLNALSDPLNFYFAAQNDLNNFETNQ